MLTAVAAVTARVRLGTYILLAALRRPVVLAKQAATLDVLSHGRLDLGVGIGWQREEYEAAGLDFAARGRLLDHSLDVCRTLWREQRASFDSPELRFDGDPRDAQAGPGRRGADLGERAVQRAGGAAARPLRARLAPLGRRRHRPRDEPPPHAGGGRRGRRRR